MAESVDALVSNTSRETCAGSTPALGTETEKVEKLSPFSFYITLLFLRIMIKEKDRPNARAVFYVSDVRKIILRREPSTAVHIQRAP